jgi:hypothetical protein
MFTVFGGARHSRCLTSVFLEGAGPSAPGNPERRAFRMESIETCPDSGHP